MDSRVKEVAEEGQEKVWVVVEDRAREAEAVDKEWGEALVASVSAPNVATGNLISEEFPALKKSALLAVLK